MNRARRDPVLDPVETLSTLRRFVTRAVAAGAAVSLAAGAVVAQDTTASGTRDLPLVPTRTAAFTTSEGSWMSVDVSPDGRTVVFDLLGDLYLLPLAGGRPTPLTSGIAFDAQPRFSPDGSRVVFVSDRDGGENLWIVAADGSDTTQLTSGRTNRYVSPEWTPDGDYIVASRGSSSLTKLWMFHVEGGSGVELVSEPSDLKMLGAAFGRDGRYVWYAERSNNWRYNAQFPQYQLAVYDRETGERYPRSSRYGSAFRPTLSADGRWLVYGTRHDEETALRIRDLRTGDERWLASPVQRDDQESPATQDVLPGMAFTPDGRELVTTYGGRLWRLPVEGGDAVEIPFEVEVTRAIGPRVDFDHPISDDPTLVVKQIRDVAPAPDGSRLAFVAMDRLWLVDLPDGTPARVTDADVAEHHPTWSPDGRWIGYVTWSDADGGHIHKTRPRSGSTPERLTATPGYFSLPAWSPDGERLVAIRTSALSFTDALARGGDDDADLVWVDAAGGDVTAVAPAADLTAPHFTADPDRIYAFRRGSGLVSMRWDGTDVRSHLEVTGARAPGAQQATRASVIRMAPRGDRALAQVQSDLYVVTVPLVGGTTPSVSVTNPDDAAFPVRRLTRVGGQFPTWSGDGRAVHWSLGNAHFVYDLDAAAGFEDSVAAADAAAAAEPLAIRTPDQAAADSAGADEGEGREYAPAERRIEIRVDRDIPRGTVALRGARVITMRGDEILERGDLVIRDNRILAVGPAGTVAVPDGAREIDVAGHTIVPGFVDTHAHLRPTYEVHKTQVWSYLANLAYGVTTTRDPQTATTDVLSYEDMVEAGRILGPRIYSTGPGIFGAERIRDADHAADVLRRYSTYWDTKTIKMYVAGNRQQRQWIIMAARDQRLIPTTEGALDFKTNLINTIDGYPGQEHSIPVYPVYRDVVELYAQSGRVYTPTLLVAYGGPWAENFYYATEEVHDNAKLRRFTPHEEIDQKTLRRGGGAGQAGWFRREQHVFDDHARFVRDLVEAGGRAGVGSHGQLQGLGYHWELWSMQSGGLSEHDALRVATRFGAEAIGLDGDLGTLEPGKLADLVVLRANPLDDIRNTDTIRFVVKNGRIYDGDTLDEVWPRQRPLGPVYWSDDAPRTAAGIR